MAALIVVLAFFSDLIFGDPQRMPHPVRAVGRAVAFLERALNRQAAGRTARLMAGLVVAVLVTACAYLAAHYAILLAGLHIGAPAAFVLSTYLAFTTVSVKGLADAARAVRDPLEKGDLPGAREALSRVVGRDTAGLDEADVVRGAVETVAENTSDGILAPLFYLAIGGPPLAIAYKAVNTMDSMIGYRNDRYAHFGRAAARLDDAANFIPARLTALLMVAASYLLSRGENKGGFSPAGSRRILKRDKSAHDSPNSGRPEAAMAGALGVRLGGENSYFGVVRHKPFIGEPDNALSPGKITDAVGIMYVTAFLGMTLTALTAYFIDKLA